MKLLAIALIFSLTACATYIPLSYDEQCALHGMKLAGVTQSSGSGSSYNFQTQSTAVVSTSSEDVRCDVPASDKDKGEVAKLSQIVKPKGEYNSGVYTKQFFNALGYYALIVPGVVMKIVFDQQRDAAIAESAKIASEINRSPATAVQP